jgi:ankyrin repeat protein
MNDFEKIVDAAIRGDLETIRTMVAEGFDLTTLHENNSVLTRVLFEDYTQGLAHCYDVVKLLLELGANPNQVTDNEGSTPISQAVISPKTEVLRLLLEAGADPNTLMDGETVYEWCEFDYRNEVWNCNLPEKHSQKDKRFEDCWLKWLDAMAVKYNRPRPEYLFLLRKFGGRTRNELYFKQLMNAASVCDLNSIREIVEQGFDLSTVVDGEFILDQVIGDLGVAMGQIEPPLYDVVKLLLVLGANPNQQDEEGSGALTEAMIAMDTEMLRVLLDAGARPNDFSGFGSSETLYDWADTDYQFHIWDINKFPETHEYINEEEWLKWLDYMAVKYNKRRPDHLFLLREYGARTSSELST